MIILNQITLDREHADIEHVIQTLKQYPNIDISKTCSELLDHLTIHFQNEERWMYVNKYVSIADHCELHRALQDLFIQNMKAILRQESHAQLLVKELTDSLINHIDIEDAKIGEYAKIHNWN